MAETVRILVLESKTTDYDLVCKSLPDYTLKQAKTRKYLLGALQSFQPDVVLADYKHPRFNGLKTLQLVQEHAPLVPVIILMDTSDEEIAVECIKAGANNYILKENIIRLGPAIVHALDERKSLLEYNQAEEALKSSDEKFRNMFETAPVGIGIADLDGSLVAFNDAMLQPGGYSREDIQGLGSVAALYYDPSQRDKTLALFKQQGVLKSYPIQFKRKDGTPYDTLLSLSHTTFRGQACIQAIVQDVTERKHAQEELRSSELKYRALVENSMQGIAIFQDQKMVYANPMLCKINGYSEAELLAMSADEIFAMTHPDDRNRVTTRGQKRMAGEVISPSDEMRLIKKDGAIVWVESFSNPIEHNGRPAVLSTVIDVTERKRTEIALAESETRLRTIVDSEPECVKILDLKGKLIEMNPAGLSMIEADSFEQVKNKAMVNIIAPDHRDAFKSLTKRVLAGSSETLAFEIISLKGTHRWLETHAVPLRNQEGIVTSLLGVTRDITERKNAEGTLKSREAIMSAVASSAQQFIRADKWEEVIPNILAKLGRAAKVDRAYIFENHRSPDGTLLTSQRYEWVSLGTEPQIDNPDLQNMSLEKVGLAHMASELENDNVVYGNLMDFPVSEQEFLSQENIFSLAVVPIFVGEQWWGFIGFDECKSKRTWESTEIDALKAAAGNLGSAIHRQETEATLRESEDRYRDLVENSRALICTHDLEGNILSVNTWAVDMLGYALEDIKTMNLKDLLTPAARKQFRAYIASIRRYGSSRGEMNILTKTGEERVWAYNNSLRTMGVEKPIVRGMARDITERKKTENNLVESENRYRGLFENTPIAIWEEDFSEVKKHIDALKQQGVTDFRAYFASRPEEMAECKKMVKVVDVNKAALEMYQADNKEELIQIATTDFSKGEQENILEDLVAIAEGKTSHGWVGEDETLKGKIIEIALTRSVAPGHEHDYSKVLVTTTDITERKQAEEALLISENRFRTVVENQTEFIVRWNNDGRLTFVNDAYCRYFGVSLEQALSASFMPLIHEDDRLSVEEKIARLNSGKTNVETDVHRVYKSDGSIRWNEWTDQAIYNTSGQLIEFQSVGRDCTQRVDAENAIRKRSAELETMREIGLELTSELDLDTLLSTIVAQAIELLGGTSGGIYLYRPEIDKLEWLVAKGKMIAPTGQLLNRGEGLSGKVLEQGQPILVNDYEHWEGRATIYDGLPFKAVIGVPIRWGMEFMGVLDVLADPPQSFSQDDVAVLELLAGYASVAIHNAKLFEDSQNRLSQLEILYETSRTFSSEYDLDLQLESIVTNAKKLINTATSGMYLYIQESNELELAKDTSPTLQIGTRLAVGEGLAGRVAQTRKPLRVDDYSTWEGRSPQFDKLPIRAVLEVPMLYKENLIGVLAVDEMGESTRKFTEADEKLLSLFANQAASVIQNTRLFQEVQLELAERKQAEAALHESQTRYQSLFENSPVLLWEEDYSQVKSYFDHLRDDGITDFQDYFDNHPEAIKACADLVMVLDVNHASLDFMNVDDKSALLGPLSKSLNEEAYPGFKAQLVSLANGNSTFESDEVNTGRDGDERYIFINLSVSPEHLDTLSRVLLSIVDITERKQAEHALEESRERFSGVVNSALDGIISIDSDQRIVLFNSSAERIFGCSVAEAMGQPINRFIPHQFRAPHDEHVVNYMKTGISNRDMGHLAAVSGLRADGTEFPVEASISRVETGSQNLYTVILRDITERRQAEKAIRESEERFSLLFDRMMDGVYRSTHDGKFLDVNPAMVKMFGYDSEEEMLRVDIKKELYFAPDERGSHILDTGQDETDTYQMRRKDGSEIWVEDHGSYVHDEQGNIIFHEGILRDVTERKRTKEIFDEQDRLLHESQKLAGLGHYRLDISSGKWESSDTLNQVLGIGWNYQTDLQGWVSLIHPSQQEEMLAYLNDHVIRDRNPFDMEYQIVRLNDEQERWVHGLGRLEIDEKGNPVRMIGTIQDITERKRNEDETMRHLKEMEALYENGLAVGRLLQPGEIGQQVIETFSKHLSWNHVAIRLKKNEDDLTLIALNKPGLSETERGELERRFSSMVGKLGQGLSGMVAQTGQPIRTGNVHTHPQYVGTQAGIQSGLYMPLKIGERVIGVISVESEKVDAFSEQDERLLATLASQAAVALENAHLYQAAQQELNDRKRAERALRTSENHYRDLADSITDIMFEMDQNLQITHWNKSAELLTGVSNKIALGKTVRAIFGDTREQEDIERVYLNVLMNRAPKSFEIFMTLNKEERVYEINAYPSTTGVSVVAKDITERKLSEIIMQKRFELMNFSAGNSLENVMRKMLDEITEIIPSPIGFFHFMDEDQSTPGGQMWSTKTLELFNVPASEGHHRALDQAGVWADAVRSRHPLIQNDYESLPEKKGVPQGHVGIIRTIVIPIIRNEIIMGVLAIANKQDDYTQQDLEVAIRFADHAWDIIERKQMELALADERNQLAVRVEERTSDLSRANSNLARALRVKDEFLANMSHELRTPLNAVLGLSESLGEQTAGPLNEKQLKYINTISESGHHLLSLINDILDLAKIDAGQITLNINKVDIKGVCEAGLRMVKQLALKKDQDVALDIDENIGLMWADERRLKQMLVNLLSNAVKFTPQEGKLGLEVRGDQEANQVSFAVWDNGIGIEDNDLPLLFQPFVQLDGGLDREASGTGLGLALVSQMARLHGGGVTVESSPDHGSRFIITLPWEPTLTHIDVEKVKQTGKLPLLPPEKNRKYTLLLIEDTQEVTMMIKDYLESAGYRMVTAQDGLEGIEQARLTHPDLILMDIQMPRVNGFEATKRLRADPRFEHTPIIALTALAMPNDRQRCLEAGMNEYISKPVNLKRLQKIIQGFLLNTEETVKSQ